MTNSLPGLLQPWGIILFTLIFLGAFFGAYFWQRRGSGNGNARPPLYLEVACIGLLGLLTGGFFWRPLTESGVWMPAGGGDFASFYYPTYFYVSEQIKDLTIPLWNPHLFAGMPLAADVQSAIFYPINWIMFLFDLHVDYGSLEWLLIVHYFLAAAFFFVFLRDTGVSRLGSLAGSIVYAFCGFMVAHFGHLPMVPVATWFPLVLLSLRRAYLSPGRAGWAWAVAGGLFTTMSLLAGHVQIFAYGLMAAGLLWLLLLMSRRLTTRYVVEWAVKGALMIAIALGIGAMQLLPSVELSTQSVRASVSYEEASEFPYQPITMLNMVLPTVYGSNPTNYNLGDYQTTENWGYCGVITLALAAAALIFRRKPMITFFAVLAVLGLVLMVGNLTIVSGWVFKFLPGFNKLRDAGRALVLLGMALAGLAAYGLDALVSALQGPAGARRNALWWLVSLTGVLVIAAFGVMPVLYTQILADQPGVLYGRIPGAINNLGMLMLWIGLAAGIGWAAYRGRLKPWTAGALIFGVLVLDLFSPNSLFNPTTTDVTAGFKDAKALNFLHQATQDPTTGIPLRVNSDTNVQDKWQPSNAQLHDLYDTGGAWNPLKLERYDYLWSNAKFFPDTPLYDLTGAAYEVISPTLEAHTGQPKWERVYADSTVNIYHDKNVVPRAFLVHESFIESRPESIVIAIRRFDHDPRHTVILEQGTPVTSKEKGTAEPGANSGESVRATRYTPNAVDMTVKATSAGWVVLTDAWYPGWEATVDGQPAKIEPADYAYRAVYVDAGEHHITMEFRPASWHAGRVVSLVALLVSILALAVLLFWPRLTGRARRGTTVSST